MVPRAFLAAITTPLLSLTRAEQTGGSLEVDVGYGIFTGIANATTGLNAWLGIRYAAPPVGDLRWQAPQLPATNRTAVKTSAFGSSCPQSYPGGSALPYTPGDEDCLFLNIYAPQTVPKEGLPVLVWIHGGGYGFGTGSQDLSSIINANDDSFIGVSIQYRLGAFGFMASKEVMHRGVVNAGLLDQAFALDWIQNYISKFGGDPERVTISGESSGAGSVMLHSIANTAIAETKLFRNAIAASPYLPTQWKYNDPEPTERYYQFSTQAGCPDTGAVFDCLVSKDTDSLQVASNTVSQGQTPYGEWAFIPVTDGKYITSRPTEFLDQKKVNGVNLMVGNNANEGGLFAHNPAAPLSTEEEVRAWLPEHFPNLSEDDITNILNYYPADGSQLEVRQETNGLNPPYANNVSQDAVGQQQRANNIYAEATFVCPSYLLASAYTGNGKSAYHYQYSVPFAQHQDDIYAYLGPPLPNQGPEFVLAFQRIWGSFITKSNPSISNEEANGASAPDPAAPNPASNYPLWSDKNPKSLNLNETGGTPYEATTPWGTTVTQYTGTGLRNAISSFDAYEWEAGRGARCELWKSLAPKVMK